MRSDGNAVHLLRARSLALLSLSVFGTLLRAWQTLLCITMIDVDGILTCKLPLCKHKLVQEIRIDLLSRALTNVSDLYLFCPLQASVFATNRQFSPYSFLLVSSVIFPIVFLLNQSLS